MKYLKKYKIFENNSNDVFLDIRKSWDQYLNIPDKYEQDDFDKVKRRLVDYMKKYYDLNYFDVIGIIDYENTDQQKSPNNDEYDEYGDIKEFNQLYNIIQWEPHIKVSELSDRLMGNDEGKYQISKIEEEPEKHPNYTRNKNLKKYKI